MVRKLAILGVVTAVTLSLAQVTPASAHEYYHRHHEGGPVLGLVRAVTAVATLPIRVAGGVVSAVTPPYPYPAQAYYQQPVYYYAPQPVYTYPQPVYYGYPQ